MSRLTTTDPKTATGRTKELLDAVQAKLGITPNMTRVMASSPAVLEAYLNFSGALSGGSLDAKLREELALVVAQENGCEYCLAAHSAIGKLVGLRPDEIVASRRGISTDTKRAAALDFARRIVDEAGAVTDEEVERVREAGYTDGEIAEIVAAVALNVFTNYLNIVAGTVVDFPKVDRALPLPA
jgi:uncharacterized peroxidase-related enzyme